MKKLYISTVTCCIFFASFNLCQADYVIWDSAYNPANDHTYYVYYSPTENTWPFLHVDHTNDITWDEAKIAAEAMGGYLATITSKEEEEFLQSLSAFAGAVKGEGIRAWIGLSDADSEGNFKWVTGPEAGQTLGYSDWMGGEPNDAGSGEDYVEWRNYPYGPSGGAWNDVPANAWGVNTFMVEINPVPEPASMLLFGIGITGLAGSRMRRKKVA